jgi:hypothetical protein
MSDKDVDKDRGEDELLAGTFDETNGVVSGLDGESDGSARGEDYSAGDPEGKHHGFGYYLTHWGDSRDDRGA